MENYNSTLVKVLLLLLCCYACMSIGSSNHTTCRTYDPSEIFVGAPNCNGLYFEGNSRAVPDGRNRVCKVEYREHEDCYRMKQYTGSLQEDDTWDGIDLAVCSAIVGMNLTFVCAMEGSNVTLYRHGMSERSHLVNIPYVTSEDAGVYECRLGDEVVTAFNVSVSGNVHIGAADDYGLKGTNFSPLNFGSANGQMGKCCRNSNDLEIGDGTERSQSLYVYGEEPELKLVGLQWDSDHYPSDLDINITKLNSLLWNFTIGRFPIKIGPVPTVFIILEAYNNFSSFFMCLHISFNIESYPLSTNESLPQNKSAVVGSNVTFECVVGSILPREERSYLIVVHLEFVPPSSSNFSQNFSASCSLNQLCHRENDDYPLTFSSHVLENTQQIQRNRFTVQVPSISEVYNGSVFVCSIEYDDVIQWQREARLTVVLPAEPNSTTDSKTTTHDYHENVMTEDTSSADNPVKYIIVVCIVVVVIVTVLTVVSISITLVLKKKRQVYRIPADEVPLTNRSILHSSQSTICSENSGSPVRASPQRNLPYFEISSVNEAQPDIIVGERRPRIKPHNSIDSGVDEINSVDNLSLEGGVRKPRTSLQLQLFPRFHPYTEPSPVRLCRSEPDLTPTATTPSTLQGSSMLNLSAHRKCVVYISYTDRMADWVKSYLKPHIESWKTTEVMLHESDMIPGLTISGERQRLIFEADKIVIVVSSDYSQSQWCSYELVHAIQKEPALCRGKIIPILVDGCESVPSVIQGLVPLPACDLDFNSRLWYAIHQTPQIHS